MLDLNYAHEIVHASEGVEEMQCVLDYLVREGKKTGLMLNCADKNYEYEHC